MSKSSRFSNNKRKIRFTKGEQNKKFKIQPGALQDLGFLLNTMEHAIQVGKNRKMQKLSRGH